MQVALGRIPILGASTLPWNIRLYIQWFVFDRSLWLENRFNLRVFYLLTSLWACFMTTNGMAFWHTFR